MKKTPLPLLVLLSAFTPALSLAQSLYWDANGDTAGAGATPTGTWGTNAFWSPAADGTVATGAWVAGNTAVFAAGSDATGPYTVTISGTQTVTGVIVEEGAVTFATGAVALGSTGTIVVNAGANLITDSSLRVTATAGTASVTLNGGTLTSTNPGAAGTFFDADAQIILGAAGGTFAHTVNNILSIVQTATRITGPGSLTKTGAGVLAIASTLGNNTYAGGTIINDGELRIRAVANTLPTTTAVSISSPGILNLNGVSQQIGSLTGNGRVGLGNGTLTVGDATSSTFTGVIENIANAGASGVTTGTGKLTKVGAGTLTLAGINTYTGATTVSAGTLALTGSIANSAVIDVQSSGTLDVSGVGGGFSVGATQTLKGSGLVTGPVTVLGALTPGASPGVLNFNNALTFGSNATMAIEIGGTSAGQFDQVNGVTNLTLDGVFTVSLVSAFDPAPGNTFDLFNWTGSLNSAGFNVASDLVLPTLAGGKTWDTTDFLANGTVAVVPETSSASLFLGSMALWGMGRRRRTGRGA